MKVGVVKPSWAAAILAAVVVLVLTLPQVSWAQEEQALIIHQVGEEQSVYFLPGIERVSFEDDTLLVVSESGSDEYLAENIVRIEFDLQFSDVQDPEEAAALVKALHLFQNQPNPFSPETRIEYELPQAGRVTLGIYSINGRLICMLVNEERDAGPHSVPWDGCNDAGSKVAGGVYFYNLTAPGIEESRRMILLP
ncbi:FlgD immunoglobulin-like domain containing protein [Candidatus Eisenbacteria bacterium]|uniref:FlgD immunoglobulin-like domain containing protein n=1 Tax=Eiseniibacteriota bacterium TaxID=2212470 RepID=A0ABV6YL00_UNCEI